MSAMSDWVEAQLGMTLRIVTAETATTLQGYVNPKACRGAVDACHSPGCSWATIQPEAQDPDTVLAVERGTNFDATLATIISRIRADYGAGSDAEAERRMAALVAEIIYPDLMGA